MRAVILLNGEPHRGEIDASNAYVICSDGAYHWAKGKVRIDENVGDFDSVKELPVPPPRKIYPAEKDLTDGEIAMERALELKADEIEIYGGGGKREDHFLGNLQLLYKAVTAGISRVVLYTNGAKIFLVKEGEHRFFSNIGQTISLLPFGGEVHIMKMWGLKYACEDLILRYGSTCGLSNLTKESEFGFCVKAGCVLCILNEEEI